MESICRFIPVKDSGDLKTVHFVYETEFKKMKQPFIFPIYYIHLVTKGTGKLKLLGREFALSTGMVYFAFPGIPYEIDGSSEFTYMYISFMGTRAAELMSELKIDPTCAVKDGFSMEIAFWRSAIQKIHKKNANLLTESVLLHTLSFLSEDDGERLSKSNNVVENIKFYIDNHYADPDLSLKKIAEIFRYTDKYLSHVFKEYMRVNFKDYLSQVRIKEALKMIEHGETEITRLAADCGYADPVYFSKAFKKYAGKTPYACIKELKKKTESPYQH